MHDCSQSLGVYELIFFYVRRSFVKIYVTSINIGKNNFIYTIINYGKNNFSKLLGKGNNKYFSIYFIITLTLNITLNIYVFIYMYFTKCFLIKKNFYNLRPKLEELNTKLRNDESVR